MNKQGVGPPVVIALVVVATAAMTGIAGGMPTDQSNGSRATSASDGTAVEVSACRTINESGRYVLTADIENSMATECITITASDVVFDGQGHTLDAGESDNKTEAIAAGYTDPPIANITIRNLVVTDWTQGVGCRTVAANVTIENVTARRNGFEPHDDAGYVGEDEGYAIYVGDTTHTVTIRDSVVVNNSLGIFIANTTNNVVRDNVVRNNSGAISLGANTTHNRIIDNRIVDNAGTGIFVGSRSRADDKRRTRVRGNLLEGNGRGVFVEHTNNPLAIVNNTISATTNESIWVAVVDGNVTIAHNTIRSGGGDGIVIDATSDVAVRDNTIRNVAGTGILLNYESKRNLLAQNRLVDVHRGLHVSDTSGRTVVRGLVVAESRNRSIRLDGAGNNTIADTTVRGGTGIEIRSTGNLLETVTVTDTAGGALRLDGAPDTRVETLRARHTGDHAVEVVGRSANVTLRNLSLVSGRVSLSLAGADAVIAAVEHIPTPPAGLYDLGVAVQVRLTGATPARDEPAELTVYHPADARNVTLWAKPDDGDWWQFDTTTDSPGRPAITVAVPGTVNLIAAPLVPTPPPTPTPTPTPSLTSTAPGATPTAPTPPDTPTASTTVLDTPGFGPGLGLLSLVLGVLIVGRIRG